MRFSRLVMPPVAPSFPPCRKRWGRKGALVTVWCVLRLRFRQVLIFGYYEHTYSPYECYGTRRLLRDTRFVSRCVKIAAVNQLCVQILQDSTDSPQIPKAGGDMLQGSECSGIYGIRIPSGPSGQRPYPLWLSGSSAAVSGSCISSKAFWASSKITCTSANASCRRERPVDRSAASAAISSPESM